MMIIGADIPLAGYEKQIMFLLQQAKTRDIRIFLAGRRSITQRFSVLNYCEEHTIPPGKISFFPYYETCTTFPLYKLDCNAWIEKDADGPFHLTSQTITRYALFCTMFHPFKAEGNSVGMMFWINELKKRGYKVHLLYYMYDVLPDAALHEQAKSFFDKYICIPVTSALVGHNKNGLNVHVDDWCGEEAIAAVKQAVADHPYDICFTNYTFFSAVLDHCHAYTRKILYTHDSFTERNKTMLEQGYPESAWISLTREGEALACQRADLIITPQEAEKVFFQQIAPENVPIYSVPPLPEKTETMDLRDINLPVTVGYIGSANYVNEHNLSVFMQALVQNSSLNQRVNLLIGGGVCDRLNEFCSPETLGQINYSLLGKVNQLGDFFKQCTVMLNPELGGTGIKIKSLDAIAHGAALLCTKAGGAGLQSQNKFHNALSISDLVPLLAELESDREQITALRLTSSVLCSRLISQKQAALDLIFASSRKPKSTSYIDEHAAPYHKPLFNEMSSCINLQDKLVLEIGPDEHLIMSRLCLANGAAKVLTCTPCHNWLKQENLPTGLEPVLKNFLELDIPEDSIDVVLGIALLEHLEGVEAVCKKIHAVLKPNGKLFMQGAPLWTSPNGHHLWVNADQASVPYSFTGNNPLANWSHLALSPDQMRASLLEEGKLNKADDVDAVISAVYYNTPLVGSNKQTPSSIMKTLDKYFYSIHNVNWGGIEKNAYFYEAAHFFNEKDLLTFGLTMYGRKKTLAKKEMSIPGLVSIIVPCFNVEQFVEECIESILAQDYAQIEIILIDDCSSDETKIILRNYAVENEHVHLVEHPYNLGLGPARNSGASQAQGEFLFFLDSDDYLASPQCISKLVSIARTHNTQMTISSYKRLDESGQLGNDWLVYGTYLNSFLTPLEAFCSSLHLDARAPIPIHAWGILINTAFYRAQQLPFPTGIHEDVPTIPLLFYRSSGVYYSSELTVIYRIRRESLSNRFWNQALCINSMLSWDILHRRVTENGLEHYLPEMALQLLGHNIYKVTTNGLTTDALEVFLRSVQFFSRYLSVPMDQKSFNSLFEQIKSLYCAETNHTTFKQIAASFPEENLVEYFNFPPTAQQKYAQPAPMIESSTDAVLHNAIFTDYNNNCPEEVKRFPAMLSDADRAVYFYLAKHAALQGLIIDAGCFVGGTTTAFITGLKQNPYFNKETDRVYVYDLFKNNEPYILQWLKNIYGAEEVPDDLTDFSCFFEKNMEAHKDMIRLHPGNIIEIGYPYKQPIEILGLDCCKGLEITDSIIRNFFPYLIPNGSHVIHQDYIHEYHPYIHISMELLQDFFEPFLEFDGGGSYVWRCIKRITLEDIVHIFGPSPSNKEDDFSWWHQNWERNDILLQKNKQRCFILSIRLVWALCAACMHTSWAWKNLLHEWPRPHK